MPQSDFPQLPKWPFITADVALLGAAWLIAEESSQPLSWDSTAAIVACVAMAAIAGAIPFLTEYSRRHDEKLDERQRALEALAQTLSSAAEQISTAVSGFQALSDSTRGNQEQAAELQVSANRLHASAERISGAATEWARLEMGTQKSLASAKTALVEFEGKIAKMKAARPPEPPPAPKVEPPANPVKQEVPPPPKPVDPAPILPAAEAAPPLNAAPLETPAVAPVQTEVESTPTPDPAPQRASESPHLSDSPAEVAAPAEAPLPTKVSRKRSPKKPLGEVTLPASEEAKPEPAPPLATAVALEAPSPAAKREAPNENPAPKVHQPAFEFSQTAEDEAAPSVAISADGATRLMVTAYIGIGNRLFVRGDGPGLSWEKGVPLQFVSIGKWKWESADASAPVRFKLYKNDETECTSFADQPIEPGKQLEVTATF